MNCGPRQRFVVRGDDGPFIVHNCVQSIASDLLWGGITNVDKEGLPVVLHVHDEIGVEVPEETGSQALALLKDCMTRAPAWADGMWIGATGFITKRYTKD